MTVAYTISATFSLRTYSINASAGTNGSISPSGATIVNCGTNQTYTITPDTCYQIADVVVDGISQGVVASYTFTNVIVNHTISATFLPITYTITASAEANGAISPSEVTIVNCGTDQTYTITPDTCYQIADVVVDGISQGAVASYTFMNVTTNHTISATFVSTTITYYADRDGDGFGDLATPLLSCTGPPTFSGNPAVTNSIDCNDFAFSATNSCATIVNLKLFIEGFYIGNNLMTPVKLNRGIGSNANEVDDIDVELRNAVNYQLVDSTSASLATNGNAFCSFSTAPSGSFYIVVKYNNAIQTWSSIPILVGTSPVSYDFTTASSKAFGGNMVEVEPGVWAFYTGDINQDEVIDASDAVDLLNDVSGSIFGYTPTDLNGDGSVDNSDTPFFSNNSEFSIFCIRP